MTDEVAFSDPAFCIQRAAAVLMEARERYGSWDLAIAAHNSPSAALAWMKTGKPPTEKIAKYVRLVRESAAVPY